MLKLAFIIPTRNRKQELEKLLNNISLQSRMPDQIIVVDASDSDNAEIQGKFNNLPVNYIHTNFPGLTFQRNLGINYLNEGIDLAGFLDDDVLFCADAIKNMMLFWENADNNTGGAVFRYNNSGIKIGGIIQKITYLTLHFIPGSVLKCGFNVPMSGISDTRRVSWLFGGGTVYRRKVLDEFRFDEWFQGYSYCEDLDISYRIAKKYSLYTVAEAVFEHYHSTNSKINDYEFGKMQLINRYYFIKKDIEYFSTRRFYWMCIVQIFAHFFKGILLLNKKYVLLSVGNIEGLIRCVAGKLR